MAKTLLVLAASTYQVPLIRTAKRLGYRVLTTDNVPDNPGHRLADACYDIDTTDADSVLAVAEREHVDGIIAAATDVALPTAAQVAARLGLVAPPVEATLTLTDKRRFRSFMAAEGLASPRVFESVEDAIQTAKDSSVRRWIVKPNRASGSKGVWIVADKSDLAVRLEQSRRCSLDGEALVEEFLEGSQHSCEGIVVAGNVAQWLLTDRDVVAPPRTATAGHRVPSRLSPVAQSEALHAIALVLMRLGVTSGPFDCDFVWTGNQAVILELTPRTGGNSLPRLMRAAGGIDLLEYSVKHAFGDAPQMAPTRQATRPHAIVILGVDHPGALRWNTQEERALRNEPWVEELTIDLSLGARAYAFTDGRHRIGEALLSAPDRDGLDARVGELKRRLDATTLPGTH
jgi:biotin carboxylase